MTLFSIQRDVYVILGLNGGRPVSAAIDSYGRKDSEGGSVGSG